MEIPAAIAVTAPRAHERPADDSATFLPLRALYSPNQIGLAQLGAPWLLALNYRRLGRRRAAWITCVLGMAASVALVLEAPESVAFAFIGALLVFPLAWELQGRAFRRHVALGGRHASSLAALATGAGWLVLLVVLAVAVQGPDQPQELRFGLAHVVVERNATADEAHAVADVLSEFFAKHPGAPVYVFGGDHPAVMVPFDDQASELELFLDRLSARAFAGRPVDVWVGEPVGDWAPIVKIPWETRRISDSTGG